MIRVLLWSLIRFVVGAVVGFIGMIVGYGVYTSLVQIHDQDGGAAIMVGFGIAPAVGLICGGVTAILCGFRSARARKGALPRDIG